MPGSGRRALPGSPLVLRRSRPGDAATALLLVHGGQDFTRHAVEGAEIRYLLEPSGALTELPEVAWADWDEGGRMLIATTGGELRIAEATADGLSTAWSHDLSELSPEPVAAPGWATRW